MICEELKKKKLHLEFLSRIYFKNVSDINTFSNKS